MPAILYSVKNTSKKNYSQIFLNYLLLTGLLLNFLYFTRIIKVSENRKLGVMPPIFCNELFKYLYYEALASSISKHAPALLLLHATNLKVDPQIHATNLKVEGGARLAKVRGMASFPFYCSFKTTCLQKVATPAPWWRGPCTLVK